MNILSSLSQWLPSFAAGLLACACIGGCEYAIKLDVSKKLLKSMDRPTALRIIQASFGPTAHQSGCNLYVFSHRAASRWRDDVGSPGQVAMTGSVVQFNVNLRDSHDNTPWTSAPLEVGLDVAKIDHIIEWNRPERRTATEGVLIEVDFAKGYEESRKGRFGLPAVTAGTGRTLDCGIAKDNVGEFLAAIRYLNPNAPFIAAR